jgi:Spy/CpxP family protein refolding chaperone
VRLGALAVVLLSACLATPAVAGPGPSERHKWWLSPEVRAEIALSDQQSQELEGIFQSVAPRLRTSWKDLEGAEREVTRLMKEGSAEEAQVVAAIDRAESARATLNRTRTLMLFRMYRALTPEQREKLSSYHERRDHERRGRSDTAPR